MIWPQFIYRDESDNLRMAEKIRSDYGLSSVPDANNRSDELEKAIMLEKEKLCDALQRIVQLSEAHSGENDKKGIIEEIISTIVTWVRSKEMDEVLFSDLCGETLLGLLYYDEHFDCYPEIKHGQGTGSTAEEIRKKAAENRLLEQDQERVNSIAENWRNGIRRKDEIVDLIRSRYPIRAFTESDALKKDKDKNMTSTGEPDLGEIYIIQDFCLGYHEVMIEGGNLYLFGTNDVADRLSSGRDGGKKGDLTLYSFKNIWEIFGRIVRKDPQDRYLFEKTVGLEYTCMLFDYMKEITELKEIVGFRELIEKSTELHAIGCRTRIMQIIMSAIFSSGYENKKRHEAIDAIAAELFGILEVGYEQMLKINWSWDFYYYYRSNDEIKNEILTFLSYQVKQRYSMPEYYLDQAYLEITREAGLFDLRLIEEEEYKESIWEKEEENYTANARVFENCCFYDVDERKITQLLNTEPTPFILEAKRPPVYLRVRKSCNELGQWIKNSAIIALLRKNNLPTGKELQDLYDEMMAEEYYRIKDRQDAWWATKDIKVKEKNLTRLHIFACIETIVMNSQISH